MKALIIEDEPLAAERLQEMLREVDPDCEVRATLGSVKTSVRWLMQHSADLIFLDIQLSDGSAFSIFDQISVTTPIIFTTAYDEFAIKAFEVNSIAYLLKPVRKQDLKESLAKYRSMESAFKVDLKGLMATYFGEKPVYKNRFLIRLGDVYKKIETSRIAYFYAMEKSVFFKTFDGKTLPIEYSLDTLENMLDPANFFRINRAYLVNMASIRSMKAWPRSRVKLELEPKTTKERDTIVSIGRAADFKSWLDG